MPGKTAACQFLLVALLTSVAGAPWATCQSSATSEVTLDEARAQNFTVTALDGKPLDLAALLIQDKPVLLHFWATWCAPCRKEMPHFAELSHRYKEQGLTVVGLSIDDPQTDGLKVKEFIAAAKANYAIAYASQATYKFFDRGNRVALPRVFLFRSNGELYRRFGRYSWGTNRAIGDAVKELMAQAH